MCALVAGRIRDAETPADWNDTDGRHFVSSPARIWFTANWIWTDASCERTDGQVVLAYSL